jgi:hypothetical protein
VRAIDTSADPQPKTVAMGCPLSGEGTTSDIGTSTAIVSRDYRIDQQIVHPYRHIWVEMVRIHPTGMCQSSTSSP